MDPNSVQYLGKYDPASTVEIRWRQRQQGVIDLRTKTSTSAATVTPSAASGNKKRIAATEFSVPGGKRRKSVQVENLARYCITQQEKWDQGAFRWVHKGRYAPNPFIPGDTGGPQNGQLCVLKEFKTGSVYENYFFSKDVLAVDKAHEIIQEFNKLRSTFIEPGAKLVQLNRPAIWQDVYPDTTGKKKKKLVEPMLEGTFLKFNSNSGYTNGAEFLQALSHYSYHHTEGKYLLCDLQGAHYDDQYVLTDPVIMSADNSKKYGSGDLGQEGIDNFFAHHKCGCFCKAYWRKPHMPTKSKRIAPSSNTTFSLTLGTKKSEAERKQQLRAILAKTREEQKPFHF